ncbi:hypothetical protein [Pedobacter sp. R-06]|uniref:hypothetical protein n=1 Tax=Pedobacter sp. R-06 TaxID=3404051 RepID=UPI003CF62A2F
MKFCLSIGMLLSTFAVSAQSNKSFDAPDQILWHSRTKNWFVSNLGGGVSFERDKNGWISRLDAGGEIIERQWVKGLDAPSGMVSTEHKLFVCDRDGVVQIDIATAKIEKMFPIHGEFINDVAIAANGDLYVSDFHANRIYRLPVKDRKAEVFLELKESPDGVLVDGQNLIIATWGKVVNKTTFETSRKGTLLTVDLMSKKMVPLLKNNLEIGNLEGIVKAGEYFYVTDWMRGALLKVSVKHGIQVVLTGLTNPTDPGYSRELDLVAFPEHTGNRVTFLNIGQ